MSLEVDATSAPAQSAAAQLASIRNRAHAAHQGGGNSSQDGGGLGFQMPCPSGDCSDNKKPIAVCGVCCCLSFILLMGFSLGSVPPLYYGLHYNKWTKAVSEDSIYDSGRFFIGPWNTLVLFPANVQNIEFTNDKRLEKQGSRFPQLDTRTREGLSLKLHFALQYTITKATIPHLFKEFNVNYEDVFVSTIRDRLNKVAMEYEATSFWEHRRELGTRMSSEAKVALNEMYADCWDLELMVIDLPDVYESAIVTTQVSKQNQSTRQFEQQTAQIRAQTSVIAAEYDRQAKVITAKGQANYTFLTKNASAVARQQTIDVESDILADVKANLTLDAPSLSKFQKFVFYKSMEKANMFLGFDGGSSMNIMMQDDECPDDDDGEGLADHMGKAAKLRTTQATPSARVLGELVARKSVKIDGWNCQCARKQSTDL